MTDVQHHIEDTIVANIASNFEVLNESEPFICKVSLKKDKFNKTDLSSLRPQLGVLIDTQSLTVSITEEKFNKLIKYYHNLGRIARHFTSRNSQN